MSGSMAATPHTIGRPVPSHRAPAARIGIIGPVLWAILLALALSAVGVLPTLGNRGTAGASRLGTVRVAPTDSLWSIAAAHPESGLSTAAVADRIARLNSLKGPRLQPGQRLIVPLAEGAGSAVAQADLPDAMR
jgi:LysM repeat protein